MKGKAMSPAPLHRVLQLRREKLLQWERGKEEKARMSRSLLQLVRHSHLSQILSSHHLLHRTIAPTPPSAEELARKQKLENMRKEHMTALEHECEWVRV